ncbi:MAG: Heme biosynthesis protein [Parcubacteria group bacterium GW2011_GWF2_46_8]|nr:MAG: Heme biosynthesis protein [Parcubacteria group bacterium GW2011_GWF1_45_5]KKU47861.1 MAG: Heme biosynthesis protein [Parcubacteria group bacterium GW2011_GWF2_46_8]
MRHYRLFLTSVRNENCSFCSVKDDPFVSLSFLDAVTLLREARRKGADYLSIDGGEVTMTSYFTKLIQRSVSLGFKKIVVNTNGFGFRNRDFTETVLEERQHILRICISLYGHNKRVHDRLTNVKGSFDATIKAIKNITDMRGDLVASLVVCSENFPFLKKYIGTLKRLKIKTVIISFVAVEDDVLWKPSFVPDIRDTIPFLQKAIDYANTKNISISLVFFPFCVLGKYYTEYATERYAGNRYKNQKEFFKGKHISKQCFGCTYYNSCPGVWEEYYKLRGFRFRPVSARLHESSN